MKITWSSILLSTRPAGQLRMWSALPLAPWTSPCLKPSVAYATVIRLGQSAIRRWKRRLDMRARLAQYLSSSFAISFIAPIGGLPRCCSPLAVLLLMVAALGIVGVTSNWVSQRRHQIGVRRALGARRRDILHRFQSENLAIVVIGVLAGGVLALAANLWLVQQFEMSRIDPLVLLPAAALIVLLSQLAAFWSALRAARVPPALTTRIT